MDIWNDYECDEQMDIFDFLGDEIRISVEKPIKLIEMFSGYGSQALALKYLGIPFEHHFVCELDKYACASYSAVHGIDVQPTDIRQVHAEDLNITETDKFTYFLTYAFPCVDLSVSGKQKGFSKQDWLNGNSTRSGLLWEVERILKELHQSDKYELPQILMMENVTQVHGIAQQIDWKNWIQTLEDLGYVSFWSDLNAKDYGIPQNRERTLMFSFLKKEFGSNIVYQFPKPFPLTKCLTDILEDVVDEKFYLTGELIDKMIEDLKEKEGI